MFKKTLHGIDMSAPDAAEQLLAFHRRTFGDAVMEDLGEDAETDETDADESTDDQTDADVDADAAADADDGSDIDGAEELGDKGKKALAAMKAKVKAATAAARTSKAEADQLKAEKANAGKTPAEQAIAAARAEGATAATAAANRKILRSEVKAAAAGKLANPALAVKLIDLDGLEVDDDGNVDEEAIAEAITELLKENPYLAAQGASVQFDSARGKPRQKKPLTAADLNTMTPEQIAKAYDEGRIKG